MTEPRGVPADPATVITAPAESPGRDPSDIPGRSATEVQSRIDTGGRSLRQHTARGVMINTGFSVALVSVSLLQRIAVAAFLTTTEYGFWGLLLATVITLSFLKQIGISDKYIQQDDPDQEAAFQKAFTLELIYSTLFFLLLAGVLPIYALAYDRPSLIVPGIVLSSTMLLTAFQAPIWISYREMKFVRQRILEAINPIFGTIVILGLAIAGFGYWSLVIGTVAGHLASAIAAVFVSPYKLRLRYDRATMLSYFGFSWPLFVARGSTLAVGQGAIMIANFTVGLSGLGAMALAAAFLGFIDRVDDIIKRTMYPAICAVQDKGRLLEEAFTKSNRLTLMWSLPAGGAMALFAPDLVHFVLGSRWDIAIPLLQSLAVVLALRQIAFNWSLFFNATGNTRPMAVHGIATLLAFVVFTVPLMFAFDLIGYAAGMGAVAVVQIAVRSRYLSQLFGGFNMVAHVWRALLPIWPALAAVGGLRLLDLDRTLGVALGELSVFIVVVSIATWIFERELIEESIGYIRRRTAPSATA